MAILKKEYTDIRNATHKVEHFIAPPDDLNSKEQIIGELLQALAKPNKRISA